MHRRIENHAVQCHSQSSCFLVILIKCFKSKLSKGVKVFVKSRLLITLTKYFKGHIGLWGCSLNVKGKSLLFLAVIWWFLAVIKGGELVGRLLGMTRFENEVRIYCKSRKNLKVVKWG